VENEEKRFGKYVLTSKLAAGGMAVTYRAKMTAAAGLVKNVVIKKIHPHLAEEEDFVEMFVREAKLAASLTHGNIAQVFDFGKTDGDYFLAMELVHGQALSRVLRRAADRDIPFLPTPIALQIACRMCDGLHYAHTRKDEDGHLLNLVHRDVSPENTLLSYEGEVKIVDFGIAKSNTGGKQTETGMVKGKYPYFSPEQAQAVRDLDARSDVYAVGVVLFEMLCGRRPYEGEFVAVLSQLAEGKLPRPTSFNPEISPALEQTMLRALAPRRDDRYQSARDLGQALAEVLHSRYPGSTSNDISMLLATLFREEQEAEGNPMPVTADFTTALMKNTQPGFGAKRRAQLGLKPESKMTPKPVSAAGKTATPARPRSTTGTGSVRVPTTGGQKVPVNSNQHGGYRPKSMSQMPAATPDVTPPQGTKLAPIEQETLLRAKASKIRATPVPEEAEGETRLRPDRVGPPRALTLDSVELKDKRQRFVVTVGGLGFGLSVLLIVGYLLWAGSTKDKQVDLPPGVPLWISSTPSGAHVTLDNKEAGVTPLQTSLQPGPHTVALTLTGFRPWTKRFTTTSQSQTFNAPLEEEVVAVKPVKPESVVADAGVEPETNDVGTGPMQDPADTAAEKRDVKWPLRQFVLRPAYNALPLDKYETANVELKPGTGYQVFTEGSYSLGKGRNSSTVLYYLEGDLPEGKRVGYLSGTPKLIKGATHMYVFVIDDDPLDNSGALNIVLRISNHVVPQNFAFDPQKHAIVPLAEHRFRLSRLNPSSKYLLTIRDDEAMTGAGRSGKVGTVLCVESPDKPKTILATQRLLEVGKRHQVTDTKDLMCLFPDLNREDNSGYLEIDIVDMNELTPEELQAHDH
jgi:serine/threonine protein kinase